MKSPVSYWLLLIVFVNILSCKGPQGDVGPQGTTGTAGAIGAQGPQGAQGAANLISSPWTLIKAVDWKSTSEQIYFKVEMEDKNITQAIIDKGVLMAYYRNPIYPSVVLSLPSVTNQVSIGYYFLLNQGKGYINFDLSYFTPRKAPIDFDLEVRWIIIPPNPGGRMPAFNWSDYNEAKRVLNLSE